MHLLDDPQFHLQLHRDRVEAALARRHVLPHRPRPPGRVRRELAQRLRALANHVDPASVRAEGA